MMTSLRRLTPLLLLIAFGLIAPGAAAASTYRWQVAGNGNWNVPANWTVVEGPAGAGYPNLAGDVAVFDDTVTDAGVAAIPAGVTITIGELNVVGQVQIAADLTSVLVFDNLGEDAVIERTGPDNGFLIFDRPIQLAAHLVVTGNVGFAAISESVASRNVTITSGNVKYSQPNTYTGTTTVADGQLETSITFMGTRIPGPLVVGDGTGAAGSAVVRLNGDSIEHTADVQVNADGHVMVLNNVVVFSPVHWIGGLTIAGGRVSVVPTGAILVVQDDMTMEGGEVTLASLTGLHVTGNLTATSTAAGPAIVSSPTGSQTPGSLTLPVGHHDVTIADGPQAVDFRVDVAFFSGGIGTDWSKLGPGVMRIDNPSMRASTAIVGGTLQVLSMQLSQWTGAVQVDASATLTGSGTVGPLTVAADGILSPGLPVGTMGSGSLALTAGSHFVINIPGTAASDRLNVTGTVSLGTATLDLSSAFAFPPTTTFTIVDNDGSDPVTGTFLGLAEGANITTASGAVFQISYAGGDGNDVVLANVTPLTYFLSEGATGTFFDEDVLIANPNTVAAPVTMTFFLPGGGTLIRQETVPAQSRLTVDVDAITGLEETTPSVEVRSDNRLPLAVERTMFWDSAHYGGHTANAVPRAERQWFFAEGVQNDFFNTFLLMTNPAGEITATVTFLRENEPPFVLDVPLDASSRTTVYTGDHAELVGRSFGIVVDAPSPVTAERATYFATTPQRLWSGGHDNVGSPETSTSWFHPEGASGTFFSTFILLSNPQDEPATVNLKFLLPAGTAPELTKTIPANSRLTINPATEGLTSLEHTAFSTVVTSNVPIVSERAMYWDTDGTPFGEGHASSGLTTTALKWALAEGRVGGPNAYTTYILLANPQSQAVDVKVTFLRESGTPVVKTYPVSANSRFNIDVGTMVPELQNESFGAYIESLDGSLPIAVERSMYWNVDGRFWSGGTNAVGAIVP